VALDGGATNHPLLALLPRDTELVDGGDRQTRRRRVEAMVRAGERIDLIEVSTRHLPELAPFLVSLDALVDPTTFPSRVLGWCRSGDVLVAIPRSLDVRILWVRTDMVIETPRSWEDLMAGGATIGFAARGLGAVAPFVERVASAGSSLEDELGAPRFATTVAVRAVADLMRLARDRGPADMTSWTRDDLTSAIAAGRVAIAALGAEATARMRRSRYTDQFWIHPCPDMRSYASATVWAVPASCADLAASLELVQQLTSFDAQRHDAGRGTIPARRDVFSSIDPIDALDERRLEVIVGTIDNGLTTLPPRAGWAKVEERIADALRRVYAGEWQPGDAVAAMQRASTRAVMSAGR
jgi:ABC-type glycerol-3-phosphate transport system substrate-binding protein